MEKEKNIIQTERQYHLKENIFSEIDGTEKDMIIKVM